MAFPFIRGPIKTQIIRGDLNQVIHGKLFDPQNDLSRGIWEIQIKSISLILRHPAEEVLSIESTLVQSFQSGIARTPQHQPQILAVFSTQLSPVCTYFGGPEWFEVTNMNTSPDFVLRNLNSFLPKRGHGQVFIQLLYRRKS